ncbi:hypothetical protein BZA77DRAFT_377803 [Pyronema omphalodes]|nr:hypothetical protein BZA77DRAFT_377803 [Pyronema omphalodes]
MDLIWRELGRHLHTLSQIDNAYDLATLLLAFCNSALSYASIAYVAIHMHSVMMRPPGPTELPPALSESQVEEDIPSHSSAVGSSKIQDIHCTIIYQDASTKPDPLLSAETRVECEEPNHQQGNKAPVPVEDTSAENSARLKALWNLERRKSQQRSEEMVKPKLHDKTDNIQGQVPKKGVVNSPQPLPKTITTPRLPVVEKIGMTYTKSVGQSTNAKLQTSQQEELITSDTKNRRPAPTYIRLPFSSGNQGNWSQRSYTKFPLEQDTTALKKLDVNAPKDYNRTPTKIPAGDTTAPPATPSTHNNNNDSPRSYKPRLDLDAYVEPRVGVHRRSPYPYPVTRIRNENRSIHPKSPQEMKLRPNGRLTSKRYNQADPKININNLTSQTNPSSPIIESSPIISSYPVISAHQTTTPTPKLVNAASPPRPPTAIPSVQSPATPISPTVLTRENYFLKIHITPGPHIDDSAEYWASMLLHLHDPNKGTPLRGTARIMARSRSRVDVEDYILRHMNVAYQAAKMPPKDTLKKKRSPKKEPTNTFNGGSGGSPFSLRLTKSISPAVNAGTLPSPAPPSPAPPSPAPPSPAPATPAPASPPSASPAPASPPSASPPSASPPPASPPPASPPSASPPPSLPPPSSPPPVKITHTARISDRCYYPPIQPVLPPSPPEGSSAWYGAMIRPRIPCPDHLKGDERFNAAWKAPLRGYAKFMAATGCSREDVESFIWEQQCKAYEAERALSGLTDEELYGLPPIPTTDNRGGDSGGPPLSPPSSPPASSPETALTPVTTPPNYKFSREYYASQEYMDSIVIVDSNDDDLLGDCDESGMGSEYVITSGPESTNEPAGGSVNDSVEESATAPVDEPIDESLNNTAEYQPAYQPEYQHASYEQPGFQQADELVDESVDRAVHEVVEGFSTFAISELIDKPVLETSVEQLKLTSAPNSGPFFEPIQERISKSISEPATQLVDEADDEDTEEEPEESTDEDETEDEDSNEDSEQDDEEQEDEEQDDEEQEDEEQDDEEQEDEEQEDEEQDDEEQDDEEQDDEEQDDEEQDDEEQDDEEQDDEEQDDEENDETDSDDDGDDDDEDTLSPGPPPGGTGEVSTISVANQGPLAVLSEVNPNSVTHSPPTTPEKNESTTEASPPSSKKRPRAFTATAPPSSTPKKRRQDQAIPVSSTGEILKEICTTPFRTTPFVANANFSMVQTTPFVPNTNLSLVHPAPQIPPANNPFNSYNAPHPPSDDEMEEAPEVSSAVSFLISPPDPSAMDIDKKSPELPLASPTEDVDMDRSRTPSVVGSDVDMDKPFISPRDIAAPMPNSENIPGTLTPAQQLHNDLKAQHEEYNRKQAMAQIQREMEIQRRNDEFNRQKDEYNRKQAAAQAHRYRELLEQQEQYNAQKEVEQAKIDMEIQRRREEYHHQLSAAQVQRDRELQAQQEQFNRQKAAEQVKREREIERERDVYNLLQELRKQMDEQIYLQQQQVAAQQRREEFRNDRLIERKTEKMPPGMIAKRRRKKEEYDRQKRENAEKARAAAMSSGLSIALGRATLGPSTPGPSTPGPPTAGPPTPVPATPGSVTPGPATPGAAASYATSGTPSSEAPRRIISRPSGLTNPLITPRRNVSRARGSALGSRGSGAEMHGNALATNPNRTPGRTLGPSAEVSGPSNSAHNPTTTGEPFYPGQTPVNPVHQQVPVGAEIPQNPGTQPQNTSLSDRRGPGFHINLPPATKPPNPQ